MRTFYIFKIQNDMAILTKDTPYNLYKTIEGFYYYDTFNNAISYKIYHDIFSYFNPDYINKRIIMLFKDNRHYKYENNIHIIDNKYKPEISKLKVYKSHMVLKTDAIYSSLLKNYLMNDNLFVCDFKNRDYFWLNDLLVK